jgi:hypothetical protein
MNEQKDQFSKVVTKIVGAETKQMANGGFMTKLKDDGGLTYTLFHTKQDGNDTKAFASFKQLPVSGIGSNVELIYKEESFQSKEDGNTYKSRKLVGLTPMSINQNPTSIPNINNEEKVIQVEDNGELSVPKMPNF